jgi:ADP-ribosylglycohydrolase
MIGAIVGDVIGSVYEFWSTKTTDFPLFTDQSRFTDDSVLTIAVADCLLAGAGYVDKFHEYTKAYPGRGYGFRFLNWVLDGRREPYDSWGNGSAMRVSPVAYAFDDLDSVLAAAKASSEVTHNHPEGIRGAQATAAAIYLARCGESKAGIREAIEGRFGYDLNRTIDEIRPGYEFRESCQETVPPAIIAFLESTDYESAVRLAISLGGDADTLACITGSIAEPFYGGVPDAMARQAMALVDEPLRDVVSRFRSRFGPSAA